MILAEAGDEDEIEEKMARPRKRGRKDEDATDEAMTATMTGMRRSTRTRK